MALFASAVLALVGLILGLTQRGTEMAAIGWMFFGFGLIFFAGNLYLYNRGIRLPRGRWRFRRPPS
jgi:uncharacterized membrane protein YgdD (TMEM256/DUF423 family)